jgi:membrane-associated phospholipid phosphatase
MLLRLIAVFVLILNIHFSHAQNVDIHLLRSINLNRNVSLDKTFNFVTNTAAPISFGVPASLWIIGKTSHNEHLVKEGVISGTAAVLSLGFSYLTKYTIQRKRPYETYPYIQAFSTDKTPSFPSNHTSVAFSSATYFSLSYPKWYVIVPSYAWASAVAYSRLHLGEHYPTDVLAGALLGAGSAFVSYKLNHWIMKQYHRIP